MLDTELEHHTVSKLETKTISGARPSIQPSSASTNMPTIFGEVLERDVTFCVDTSGSMFNCIHVVKEHLIEALMEHALREGDTTFNIIEFNSEVTKWADKMVACTPETVKVASEWIQKLNAKTGTNTLDALLTAFQDRSCQAVYLVTDGLPDDFVEDILDTVIEASNGRPIHCIYLSGEKADTVAVEFLEELAVESFGSFHVVTLTTHGCVERISPIYRSDHAAGRVIRTINNTLHPSVKTCSVSTTLQIDPEEVLANTSRTSYLGLGCYPPYLPPWWRYRFWGLGFNPLRYYFPTSWSRYRPAKSWLKFQDKLLEPPEAVGMSPAAGSLLIGKTVLARRISDGYFYLGKVQSQATAGYESYSAEVVEVLAQQTHNAAPTRFPVVNDEETSGRPLVSSSFTTGKRLLDEKFLVAFGPCKHGRYRETTYQDTFVFDIVDYCDAQRHTIITGDHVLAPWEPEGERFGPGIVIEGQEKRQAIESQTQGPEDRQLTVAFSNGRTEKVALDRAIWVPEPVYERVALELKMPREARSTLMTTDHYPLDTLPGYPTSGPYADPPDYFTPEYFTMEPSLYYPGWDRFSYPPYLGCYHPYPVVMRRRPASVGREERKEDSDEVIPGTDMTRRELDERVLSQLREHRLATEEEKRAENKQQQPDGFRLLKRREKQEENSLKKSVTFSESDLVHVAPDSARTPLTYSSLDVGSGMSLSNGENDAQLQDHLRDRGMNTDSSLLFYHSRGFGERPPWKYWKSNPSPDVSSLRSSGGGGGGGSSGGGPSPFRETALQAPLEARDQRKSPYIVEWASPAFKYVDTFAKHDYSNSVDRCLRTPHPPWSGVPEMTAESSYHVPITRPPTEDEKEEARRQYKRFRHVKRQMAWQERLANEDHMKSLMQDGHRERIQAQINRERERQQQEQAMIQKAREAKKKISEELCRRIEENQEREKVRDEQRVDAMRQRRERREALETQRQKEIDETTERRDQIRHQNSMARSNAITAQLNEQDARAAALDTKHRNAKMQRINHFSRLEDQAQAKKDLRIAVSDQHLALYRSQIFA